jgi:hypothetical protein
MRRLREGRRGGLMLDTMNGRRMGGRASLLGMVIFVEWHRRMHLRKYDSTLWQAIQAQEGNEQGTGVWRSALIYSLTSDAFGSSTMRFVEPVANPCL